jgi:arabinose-5-phosphate isomerase
LSSKKSIVALAKETIAIESLAISQLSNFIDDTFAEAVEIIYNSTGRVIITGIGKSAIIANKIVATLNSTGTPSVFMHAADAIHGDLGLILKDDVVICISKSGNTPEIKVLIPFLKNAGNTLIAITGNQKSVLAEHADFEKEACPINLAPTTSTTAQLVIGDALAVCLLELRGFTKDDFAKYHPGGALGKKLFLKVSDILVHNEIPNVNPDASIKKVIIEISEKRKGVTAVTSDTKIVGIITDGDLRRMLSETEDLSLLKAEDIMSKNPISITINAMAIDAMELMDTHRISQLLVEDQGNYAGVIHIHDLIKEGII